jgi:hypothetical protein
MSDYLTTGKRGEADMDPGLVRKGLVEVLTTIQSMSGLECPPITDDTKPAQDLKKFNSKMWPVGTGMLAASLGVTIPVEVCIFRLKGTRTALSVGQIVPLVCRIIAAQVPSATTAAE